MIAEDYISFEVAKLLKEKGFDGECDYLYVNGNIVRAQGYRCNWNKGETIFADYKNECSAPTLQMAMKWLRKVHKLYVSVIPAVLNWEHQDIQDGWACEVTHLSDLSYDGDYEFFQKKYQTYESACEAAIRYCLENLI